MTPFGVLARISFALAMAPFIPFGPGVSTISAPKAFSSTRRSMLIVSGIVRISLYPFTAATNARAIPVLPLVGSIRMVSPGLIRPAFSALSIMANPMRSFTLAAGFRLSSLATTVAGKPADTRFRRTKGVRPISSVTFAAIRAIFYLLVAFSGKPSKRRIIGPEGWICVGFRSDPCGAGKLVRNQNCFRAHPRIAAITRAALATSMHGNRVVARRRLWQVGRNNLRPHELSGSRPLYPEESPRTSAVSPWTEAPTAMSKPSIAIHLPDGSIREVPQGTTPLDIANSISPRLAAASVVARTTPVTATNSDNVARDGQSPPDGKSDDQTESEADMYTAENSAAPHLVDLSTPLTADTRLELVKEN